MLAVGVERGCWWLCLCGAGVPLFCFCPRVGSGVNGSTQCGWHYISAIWLAVTGVTATVPYGLQSYNPYMDVLVNVLWKSER